MKTKLYSVWEETAVHTDCLLLADAEELCARLQRCFPDITFFIAETTPNEPKH